MCELLSWSCWLKKDTDMSNSGLIFPLHIHYNALQCQIMPLSRHKCAALLQQPDTGNNILHSPWLPNNDQSKVLSGGHLCIKYFENRIPFIHRPSVSQHSSHPRILAAHNSHGLVISCLKFPPCFTCLYQYFIYLPGNDFLCAPQNICYFCAMLQ